MASIPGFDVERAHKYFSAACFNQAWEFIEKPDRTPEDDEQMLRLVHASLWHWMQRPDCSDKNLSIGYWQASRVYALVGEADNARKFGRLCLEKTPADEPFLLGCAYEALARAESTAGNRETAKEHLAKAWRQADAVTDAEDRKLLVADLQTLE